MKVFKKILKLILIYTVFFFILYGPFVLVSKSYLIRNNISVSSEFLAIYIFIIIPILSFFFIPVRLIKKYNFNKYFVWIFDIVIVYLAAISFSIYLLSSFTWGGF